MTDLKPLAAFAPRTESDPVHQLRRLAELDESTASRPRMLAECSELP
jgi:hypothetical protein